MFKIAINKFDNQYSREVTVKKKMGFGSSPDDWFRPNEYVRYDLDEHRTSTASCSNSRWSIRSATVDSPPQTPANHLTTSTNQYIYHEFD